MIGIPKLATRRNFRKFGPTAILWTWGEPVLAPPKVKFFTELEL